jgi:hypothetical protein
METGMEDRKNDLPLLEALRQALADGSEHRLYKSGKLDGLFPAKNPAAAEALRDGYLESVRTEVKGKASVEWVRLTPKGIDFVYRRDSPRAVLEELQELMGHARSGAPAWLADIRAQMQALETTFGTEMEKYLQRLDALAHRVDEALRRVDAGITPLAGPLKSIVPWAHEALTFLDRRKTDGRADPCPLPDLFAAVRVRHPHLSVPDFQQGLKRLADNRAVALQPFAGPGLIPQPEHAIPDGAHMLYYASR